MNKIQKFIDRMAEKGVHYSYEEAERLVEGIEECKELMREEAESDPIGVNKLVNPSEYEKLEILAELEEEGVEMTNEEYDELLDVLQHLYEKL